ncbi:hypothetical protein PHYPSEUDO_011306 [Phytophthora pseudosyringae]|uniref:Uncharacterized protein n=1 Tax=Phytophthora pseudosyringae TaxID=221518 RepID=A0A8T1W6B1_9STRA|nr:hypothetical protein PHYPSEUDO_011306 [Phytophthora pseudosyringae]
MDGFRQTLLGRALADALQDLEKERGGADGGPEVDGDLLFLLFDEAVQSELRDRRCKEGEGRPRTFTHESLELKGQVTAFNRFMGDWSVLVRTKPQDIRLNHGVADLHLPMLSHEQEEEEQEVAMRLKLRKRA